MREKPVMYNGVSPDCYDKNRSASSWVLLRQLADHLFPSSVVGFVFD
jgi:hypothetical protein